MDSKISSHISIETLFESARMKAGLDAASQSHLNDCDLCRGRLSWMDMAASLGNRELEYEPPKALLANVLALGRRPGLLKQLRNFIVASMIFDSFTSLAPVGVRHAETAARQITYEAGDVEIAISLQPAQAPNITITGQVLRKDGSAIEDESGHVDLVLEGDHIAAASLSDWGEFVFPDLPQAPYALQFSVRDQLVRVPVLPQL
jgi:hypothetical protein